jgi:hypothetical protein
MFSNQQLLNDRVQIIAELILINRLLWKLEINDIWYLIQISLIKINSLNTIMKNS